MTIQRAFEIIKNEMPYESGVISEALNMVENTVEKQIPKKLIIDNRNIHYVDYKDYLCPCCKKRIITKIDGDFIAGRKSYYCDNCGQALDWSENNG